MDSFGSFFPCYVHQKGHDVIDLRLMGIRSRVGGENGFLGRENTLVALFFSLLPLSIPLDCWSCTLRTPCDLHHCSSSFVLSLSSMYKGAMYETSHERFFPSSTPSLLSLPFSFPFAPRIDRSSFFCNPQKLSGRRKSGFFLLFSLSLCLFTKERFSARCVLHLSCFFFFYVL